MDTEISKNAGQKQSVPPTQGETDSLKPGSPPDQAGAVNPMLGALIAGTPKQAMDRLRDLAEVYAIEEAIEQLKEANQIVEGTCDQAVALISEIQDKGWLGSSLHEAIEQIKLIPNHSAESEKLLSVCKEMALTLPREAWTVASLSKIREGYFSQLKKKS